jgi:hypothetical protein
LNSFKIEQTHFISSLNKTLESLEELPLSTKTLSQVKYLKEEFKKVKRIMKRKMFSSTDVSGSYSSGEGEMIEQLEEEFHTTGKKGKKVQILTVLPKS